MKNNSLYNSKKYDVVVIGSGPSGMGAVLAAGKLGLKVALVESNGSIGGISTTGLMSHWVGSVNCRLYDDIIKFSCEKDNRKLNGRKGFINTEALKLTYIEQLKKYNVDIYTKTTFVDVDKENDKIKSILVARKCELLNILGDVFIDCTGDGDVAYKAQEEYSKGRDSDGKMQPATLMFKVGGVRKFGACYPGSFESRDWTHRGLLQNIAKEKLPFPLGHVLLYRSPKRGIAVVNMTNIIDIDGTNNDNLTNGYIDTMLQVETIIKFLRKYVRGYKHCYLLSTAELLGIRETRRIHGLYTLTEKDIYEAKVFDDAVVFDAYFNFDVHNITGAGLDKTGVQKHYTQKKGYTIPYRCLLPKKTDNLLMAGRCISGTHIAHSNYRAMPICFATGVASGIAAYLAIKKNILVKDVISVDIVKILQSLTIN